MIRIILKESASKISDFEYATKHIRFLKQIPELRYAVRYAAGDDPDSIFFAKAETEWWLNIIESIKPLRTEHIVRVIGFGARGGAFLLTNGNVLKVGLENDDYSGDEALEIPGKITNAQFRGKGSIAELNVYDSGQFYVPHSRYRWAWREVPIYTTFSEWAAENVKDITTGDFRSVAEIANDFGWIMQSEQERLGHQPEFSMLRKRFMREYINSALLRKLGKENSSKFLRAIYSVNTRRDTSSSLDLHYQNLGVDQHGNFVFFDF